MRARRKGSPGGVITECAGLGGGERRRAITGCGGFSRVTAGGRVGVGGTGGGLPAGKERGQVGERGAGGWDELTTIREAWRVQGWRIRCGRGSGGLPGGVREEKGRGRCDEV